MVHRLLDYPSKKMHLFCDVFLFVFSFFLMGKAFSDDTLLEKNKRSEKSSSVQTFILTYNVEIHDLPVGASSLDVFLPVAQSDARQTILSMEMESDLEGRVKQEGVYGNRYWHAHLDRIKEANVRVRIRYQVERHAVQHDAFPVQNEGREGERSTSDLALFLQANRRVPVSGALIERIRQELPKHEDTPMGRAKAVYDYVLEHMEYKKTGTGWGNGDTYWACLEGYGNCTDFHALFTSLARAEGVPVRFSIGFLIPEEREEGALKGYHCWADFYLPGRGWVPIDASEAWKDPARRDYFFGNLPPDRLRLSSGRDLQLGSGHQSGPLNYFVYPHVEVGGRLHESVKTLIQYKKTSLLNR